MAHGTKRMNQTIYCQGSTFVPATRFLAASYGFLNVEFIAGNLIF